MVLQLSLQYNDYILLALLLAALFFDLTRKKIPNFLTFPVMLWGLLAHTITGGPEGFLFSVYGLLLGLAIFSSPLCSAVWRRCKTLGAIGAIKGLQFVFYAAVFTAFCGGILLSSI